MGKQMDIIDKILLIQEGEGMTDEELCDRAGISRQYWYLLRNKDRKTPSFEVVKRLLDALDRSLVIINKALNDQNAKT